MRCCVLCGSTDDVTQHHVGGRNLIAWFTMPLCSRCQVIFHAKQRAADIDLRPTPNPFLRLIRALKMTVLFMWVLLDLLEHEILADIGKVGVAVRSTRPRSGND
jgi:hypothetical protein